MIGEPSFTHVFPADVAEAQRLFGMKMRGDTKPFRFTLRRKDVASVAVAVAVQGIPMHNAAGEFKGIVGTFSVT